MSSVWQTHQYSGIEVVGHLYTALMVTGEHEKHKVITFNLHIVTAQSNSFAAASIIFAPIIDANDRFRKTIVGVLRKPL